jgi:hypothetical protein
MEEKSILDATEYILLALNNIKNFTEFNEYKEEIIKAVYDIRNSITNITNSKNIIQPNINEQIESNKNNSSISSMLGLKFNYDAYLKDFNINNYNNQISFSNSNGNFNYMKQNNINEYNDLNNMDENINDKKNSGLMSLKEENMNFDAQENKEDNAIYNKSIRNRFKGSKKNNGNANMNEIKNENKEKNRLINLKENSNDINKNIQADINPKKNKNLNSQYKKDKLSLIADIIMKINSEDEFYEILTKLFGNDLTDKLMSSDVSDELLEAVQNSIKEIEELKKKDNLNEELNQKKEEINQEEIEEEPRKFPVNEIMGANVKDKNNKKFNKESNNVYQEFDFKKNLRKNDNFEGKKKNKINNNGKKEKPFISATSAYGNYFDPPLQKGGISKLDDYKK